MKLFFFTFLLSLPSFAKYPAGFCNHGDLPTPGVEKAFENFQKLPDLEIPVSLNNKDNNGPPNFYTLGMKLLVLSATNDILIEPGLGQIEQSLLSLGLPYDLIVLTENGKRISETDLSLKDELGNPKYYGVVTTTGILAFQDQAGLFHSALTPNQWKHLEDYERKYRVKRASMYSFPNQALGMRMLEAEHTIDNLIKLDEQMKPHATGITQDLELPLTLAYHYPAEILPDTNFKIKPVAYFQKIKESDKKRPLAGIILTQPDGREQLHFFFAQSKYSTASVVLTPLWIHWLTNGIYIGKRRLHLNVHIDDVFLSTGLWDPYGDNPRNDTVENFIYRLTALDLEAYKDWQQTILRPLAKNYQFRIEMAFNGRGIWENGGYDKDSLLKKAQELLEDFYWVTHTFTHPDLNFRPYAEADWELKANKQIAQDLIGDKQKWFSPKSIVTPRISGLFNPFVLKALLDNQIYHVVGDNTRKELMPEHIHRGLYSTVEVNGYDGVLIIPRYATNIFFNVSTPAENLAEYNHIYRNHFGRDSTIDEIYERERLRVVKQLLNFEHAPYMFHQANMRTFPWGTKIGGRESLLSLWMKEIMDEVRKYSTLTILNYKMDDLVELYKERMQFEACGFSAKLVFDKGKAISILARSKNTCVANFTGIKAADIEPLTKWENYGPDRTTYFKMKTNHAFSIPLR